MIYHSNMESYLVDFDPEDIGEMIMMIRVQYLKLHVEPFAKRVGVKASVIEQSEEGRGPHGLLILKKINKNFKQINCKIDVSMD